MESFYDIVAIRVNETSWAHVWRLRSRYLRTGCDIYTLSYLHHIAFHSYLPNLLIASLIMLTCIWLTMLVTMLG
jgi:hypothetical protein